jgi:hypothetical protein
MKELIFGSLLILVNVLVIILIPEKATVFSYIGLFCGAALALIGFLGKE